MNRLYPYLLTACLLLAACNDDGVEMPGGNTGTPDDGSDTSGLTGYADPAGVMLLSAGTYTQENAFLTFVRPDGEVENDVFAAVNGTDLGNDGVGLCLSDGKQYILCNDWHQAEGKVNNGLLTVADARTFILSMTHWRKWTKTCPASPCWTSGMSSSLLRACCASTAPPAN